MNPQLPLADRYLRFRDAVFSGIEDRSDLPGVDDSYSELDWQSLWFSGALGESFQSTEGQGITITDFGVWNSGPGPDFRGCVIQRDGVTYRGGYRTRHRRPRLGAPRPRGQSRLRSSRAPPRAAWTAAAFFHPQPPPSRDLAGRLAAGNARRRCRSSTVVVVLSPETRFAFQEKINSRLQQSLDYFYPLNDREQASKSKNRLAIRVSEVPAVFGKYSSVEQLKKELLSRSA